MIKQDKSELRAHYRCMRDGILPEERAWQAREICELIVSSEAYARAQSVLLYAAIGSEMDLSPVAHDAWEKGKTVAYPRCDDREGRMTFFAV